MAAETIDPDDAVDSIDGIGPSRRDDLEQAGYSNVGDMQGASVNELSTVIPARVAQQVKEQIGDRAKVVTSIAEAKEKAQKISGAKAKTVKRSDGRQETKVLELDQEQSLPGAHMTIRKG